MKKCNMFVILLYHGYLVNYNYVLGNIDYESLLFLA